MGQKESQKLAEGEDQENCETRLRENILQTKNLKQKKLEFAEETTDVYEVK